MRFFLWILFSSLFFPFGKVYCQQQFQVAYSDTSETNCVAIDYSLNGGYVLLNGSGTAGNSFAHIHKLTGSFQTDWSLTLSTSDSILLPVTSSEIYDGSVIIASDAGSQNQNSILLVKIDSSGSLVWSTKVDRTQYEVPKNILPLSDGSFYVCGISNYNSGSTQKDILLSKFSDAGQPLWAQIIGGTREEDPAAIIRTTDDQLAVAGTSNSFSNGTNFFLSKLDTAGNYYWFITYPLGLNDTCRSLLQTNDGGYLLVGTGGNSGQDILIMKTDANGYLQFARVFDLGFSSNSLLDDGYRILSTSDGGIAIAGTTCLSTSQSKFLFLIKMSQNLVTEWFTSFGFQYSNKFSGILQTPDNGYLISGSRKNNLTNRMEGLLIKTDSLGVSRCFETSLNKTDMVVNPLQFSVAPSSVPVTLAIHSDSVYVSASTQVVDTSCYLVTAAKAEISAESQGMEIYPNPVLSSTKIFISSSPKIKGIFTWDMSDFSGRIVKRGLWNSSAEDQNLTIETIGMKPGIYCISLTCAEKGILLRKKVLVLK